MGLTVEALFHMWDRARVDVDRLQRRLQEARGNDASRLNEAMEKKLRTMNLAEIQIINQRVKKEDTAYLLTMAVESKRAELLEGEEFSRNWELVVKALEGLNANV